MINAPQRSTEHTQSYRASPASHAAHARAASAPERREQTDWTRPALVALLVLVAAGAVRLATARELWLDETHSAHVARSSFAAIVQFIRGDSHPPLHFLLLGVWSRIFGNSELALRSLSILAHLGVGIVLYAVSRQSLGRAAAWLACALTLLSPGLFYYASEARGYSLMAFLLTCTFACIWMSVLKPGRESLFWAAGAGVLMACSVYDHYASLFIGVALGVAWLTRGVLDRNIRAPLLGGLLALALVGPWLPTIVAQRRVRANQDAWLDRSRNTDTTALNYGTKIPEVRMSTRAVGAALDLASVAGVYPARQPIVLLVLALPILAALLFAAWRVFKGDWLMMTAAGAVAANVIGVLLLKAEARRYFVPSGPFIALLLTGGVLELRRRTRTSLPALLLAASLVALVGVGSVRVALARQGHPIATVVQHIRANAAPSDVVILNAEYAQVPFDFYAQRAGLRVREIGFPVSVYDFWRSQPFRGWGGPPITHRDLKDFVRLVRGGEGRDGLWLVLFEQMRRDPHNELLASLKAGAKSVDSLPICGEPECRQWLLYRIRY